MISLKGESFQVVRFPANTEGHIIILINNFVGWEEEENNYGPITAHQRVFLNENWWPSLIDTYRQKMKIIDF